MSRNKHPRINQYKIDNENFLLEKAKEEGITALESGVLIQKLEEGRQVQDLDSGEVCLRFCEDGRHPVRTDCCRSY